MFGGTGKECQTAPTYLLWVGTFRNGTPQCTGRRPEFGLEAFGAHVCRFSSEDQLAAEVQPAASRWACVPSGTEEPSFSGSVPLSAGTLPVSVLGRHSPHKFLPFLQSAECRTLLMQRKGGRHQAQ